MDDAFKCSLLCRVRHVELAFQSGAIETLLISDELFRFVLAIFNICKVT